MCNFIIGGRLGDAVHMLYVVKHWPGGPHNVYVTDRRDLHSDGFMYDPARTVDELRPVLLHQSYIASVSDYNGEDAINLNLWRQKAYSDSWTNLLSKMFGVPVVGEAWMEWDKWPKEYSLAHRSHFSQHPARAGNWAGVEKGTDIGNSFSSLSYLFSMIASCTNFTGEQSLPLAIAHALDVPRIGVLNPIDAKAYIGEEKIFSKFSYVL